MKTFNAFFLCFVLIISSFVMAQGEVVGRGFSEILKANGVMGKVITSMAQENGRSAEVLRHRRPHL